MSGEKRQVKIVTQCMVAGRPRKVGEIISVTPSAASDLISIGRALPNDSKGPKVEKRTPKVQTRASEDEADQ